MKCVLFGGSGEVGGAVARALIESDACSELLLIGRRELPEFAAVAKVRQSVVDTAASDFDAIVAEKVRGFDVGICCIGVGSGTRTMTEAEMAAVEVELSAAFARACKAAGIENFELLTAVAVDENTVRSRIKYTRVIGKKFVAVRDVGFKKLAVFRPGMIVGNKHTPSWATHFTALIPDSLGFGNIHQDEIGRAFAAHLETQLERQAKPVIFYANREMKALCGK